MQRKTNGLRNFGVLATDNTQKRLLESRLLESVKSGFVDEISDSSPAARLSWTPRSSGFAGESTTLVMVDDTSRAIDGAVLLASKTQSDFEDLRGAFREVRARGVPCLAFVDDMADERAIEAFASSLATELEVTALPIHLPWSDGPRAQVIDVIDQRLVVEHANGRDRALRAVPRDARGVVERMRRRIVDTCAEFDESILGATSVGLDIGADELARAVRKAVLARHSRVLLVATGSLGARRNVRALLDAVVAFLPSPADRPAVFGFDPRRQVTVARFPRESDAFCGLVIATTNDARQGPLTWLRVYSGALRAGAPMLARPSDKTGRASHLFLPRARGNEPNEPNEPSAPSEFEEIAEAGPGSIVCVTGLDGLRPGETLSDPRAPLELADPTTAKTVLDISSAGPRLQRLAT